MPQRIFSFLFAALILVSCSEGQSQTGVKPVLSAVEFEQALKNINGALVLDVRTPGEFAKGHLENAVNIDISSPDFDSRVAQLDKNQPVLVYCLSGGRSSTAGSKMRRSGFKQVQEMQGGTLAWKQAGLPLVTAQTATAQAEAVSDPAATPGKPMKFTNMTESDFQNLLNSEKLVLIDYYAEWCGPCKMMKPFLDEMTTEMADKLVIYRLDVDKNEALATAKGITGLPTLVLYKGSKSVWNHLGYIDKAGLTSAINAKL
jgi:thioredoxin